MSSNLDIGIIVSLESCFNSSYSLVSTALDIGVLVLSPLDMLSPHIHYISYCQYLQLLVVNGMIEYKEMRDMRLAPQEKVRQELLDRGLKIVEGETYKGVDAKMSCIDNEGYLIHSTLYRIRTGEPFRFGKNNPYTIENIRHYIKYNSQDTEKITLLSDTFKSSSVKLSFSCEEHGKFKKSWNDFQQGSMCPKCGVAKRNILTTKTHSEFAEEVFSLVRDEYSVLDKYEGARTKIAIKHNKCGLTWDIEPYSFLAGIRCPKCMRGISDLNRRKTHEDFKDEFYKVANGEYELLNRYTKMDDKIQVKHIECGNIYKVVPYSFLAGRRCPKCTRSRGEKVVLRHLRRNHIEHKSEYKIDKCRNKLPLPFDFAIFDKGKLTALIEYQGIQHYKPIEFFGGESDFEYRNKNDNIKRNYCKINDIPLIEIPYTIKNIEGYLDENLLKLNKPMQLALTR